MTGESQREGLAGEELLARYVFRKEFVRADGTLKPDPFIPYRHTELSVTRHIGLDDAQIWELGEGVAAARRESAILQGRGDVQTSAFMKENLSVRPDPIEGNPNHANVYGWPDDKAEQRAIALEIVKSVTYLPKPIPREE